MANNAPRYQLSPNPTYRPDARGLWTALAIVAASLALPAMADADQRRIELTPTIGWRSGGEFNDNLDVDFDFDVEVDDSESVGVTLGIALNRSWMLEFLWDEQDSALVDRGLFLSPQRNLFDIGVTYAHVGVSYEWSPGQLRPFIVGSVGVTEFNPEGVGTRNESRASTSIGGGVKLMFNDHIGLRFEGRLFSTFLDNDDDFYCYDSGRFNHLDDCSTDDDFFFQATARGGLVIAF